MENKRVIVVTESEWNTIYTALKLERARVTPPKSQREFDIIELVDRAVEAVLAYSDL